MAMQGWNGRKLIVCFHTFMTAKVTSGKTMRMHADEGAEGGGQNSAQARKHLKIIQNNKKEKITKGTK